MQSSPIIAKVTNTSDGRLLIFVIDSTCRVQKKGFSKSLEIWQVCYHMISPTTDLIVNFDTRLVYLIDFSLQHVISEVLFSTYFKTDIEIFCFKTKL